MAKIAKDNGKDVSEGRIEEILTSDYSDEGVGFEPIVKRSPGERAHAGKHSPGARSKRRQAALAAAERKRREALGESFEELLHPRDRHGRFAKKPEAAVERLVSAKDVEPWIGKTVEIRGAVFGYSPSPPARVMEVHGDEGYFVLQDAEGKTHEIDLRDVTEITPSAVEIPDLSPRFPPREDGDMITGPVDSLGHRDSPVLPGVVYNEEVAAITGAADAERVLGEYGLEAHLTSTVRALHPEFYKQITQATLDALRNFPALGSGTEDRSPLRGVMLASAVHEDVTQKAGIGTTGFGIWGATGADPRTTSMAVVDENERPQPRSAGLFIMLNDYNTGNDGQGPFEGKDYEVAGADIALADQSAYGRMTHELGHAVASASGFSFSQGPEHYADPEVDAFTDADLGPEDVQALSKYGASSAPEAWAEIFTTLNTPGALDHVRPGLRKKLLNLKEHAVYDGQRLL